MWRKIFLGANLLPEGLELGEMKIGGTADIEDLEPAYIIAYTGNKYGEQSLEQRGHSYNGIYSSVLFCVCSASGFPAIMDVLLQSDDDSNHILTVFSIPKLAVKSLIPIDPPRANYLLF